MITNENDHFLIFISSWISYFVSCLFISFLPVYEFRTYKWNKPFSYLLQIVSVAFFLFLCFVLFNIEFFNYFDSKSFFDVLLFCFKIKTLTCFRNSMKARFTAMVMGETRLNVVFTYHFRILFLSKWKWNTHISSHYHRLHNKCCLVCNRLFFFFFFGPVICNGYLSMLT